MKERLNSTIQVITDTPSEIRLNVIIKSSSVNICIQLSLDHEKHHSCFLDTSHRTNKEALVQTLTPVLEGNENVVY